MSRVLGATLLGVEGHPVEVEVRISSQLPKVEIVGLAEAAVRESQLRVRAAIHAANLRFPDRRIPVNLAPAGLRKSGAALDLAIAVGILAASGGVEPDTTVARGFLGELALDGRLRPVRGALALTLAARDAGCREVVVPRANASEAALAPEIRVVGASDLLEVCGHLSRHAPLAAVEGRMPSEPAHSLLDLRDVRGQEGAKRALEIAAAGRHGLLLVGPPGSGKTMLARRLPGLLPPLDITEAIEATRIHGAAGRLPPEQEVVGERPFRAPHHSASAAGLLGGGNPPKPGEISLAHAGVLFLDEILEFRRQSLEALREVLESRRIVISRAGYSCTFPADFLLVAACNPCPCGWHKSNLRDCRCDDAAIDRYHQRLSGPLRDRIDLQLLLPAVSWRDLESERAAGETSSAVRDRVMAARRRQSARGVASNAEIPDSQLDRMVAASAEARALLGRAVDRLGLSARGARRVLRVARTIADLEGERSVPTPAIAEAVQYREVSGGM